MAKLTDLSRDRARQLRAASSDAEAALRRLLRGRRLAGREFRRQLPIPPWIADVACVEARFCNDDIRLRPEEVRAAILEALGGLGEGRF